MAVSCCTATPVTVKAQVQPKDELALNLLGKPLGPLDDHIGQGESKANKEKQNETNSAIDKKPMSLRGILAAWCAHCKKRPKSLHSSIFEWKALLVAIQTQASPFSRMAAHGGSFGTGFPAKPT